MPIQEKKWYVPDQKQDITDRLLTEIPSLSPITAQILISRGVETASEVYRFLSTDLNSLHNPFLLKDMDKAVGRIEQALGGKEKILIYGDYDADGITSTTLLLETLRSLGGIVSYHLPHRLEEGYGLNKLILDKAKVQGVDLIITVDCGISCLEEVEYAQSLGLDIIITDHHHPGEQLPEALAIINPKRVDCPYPFKDLAGVGVAYKLANALISRSYLENSQELLADLRELVAIGTIADIVPLIYENRILVKHGLNALNTSKRAGLQALKEVADLEEKEFSTHTVGFMIAPRLNALGRLCNQDLPANLITLPIPNVVCLGVELLLTSSLEEAREIAGFLNAENKRRQLLEGQILEQALEMLERDWNPEKEKVIVLGSEDWHVGVIGIVAARLLERYYRPVILLNFEGEKAKGSARSIRGFHVFQAFQECQDLLDRYGGHELAAGLTLNRANLPAFRERINLLAEKLLSEEDLVPSINIDVDKVDLDQLSFEILEELESLSPYGCENRQPLLASRNVKLMEYKSVGSNNNHLKLKVASGKKILDGIGFGLGIYSTSLSSDNFYNLAFALERNEWKGRVSLQLRVEDLQLGESKVKTPKVQPTPREDPKIYYTEVVGVQQNQRVISCLQRGQTVSLSLTGNNSTAKIVKVNTLSGEAIGFLNNRLSKRLAPYLKAGFKFFSWVVLTRQLEDNWSLKIAISSCDQEIISNERIKLPEDFNKTVENFNPDKKLILVYPSPLESMAYYRKLACLMEGQDKRRIAQASGGMSLLEISRLLAYWSADKINILLVSRNFYSYYQDLFLACGSPEQVDVRELDIDFCYLNDLAEIVEDWEKRVPSRDFLVCLYKILKAQIPQGSMDKSVFISLHLEEISSLLERQKLGEISSLQILAGMDILEEMNLLEREFEGEKHYIYRLPIPKDKFNLPSLLRYREDSKVKERLINIK